MADTSECADTAHLLDTGVSLLRQFEKVLSKMAIRQQVAGHHDCGQKPPAGQQMKQNWTQTAGNCCGNLKAFPERPMVPNASIQTISSQTPVRMEPSELSLMIKLDTWIADDGNLVVRPSLVEDSKAPGMCAGQGAKLAGDGPDGQATPSQMGDRKPGPQQQLNSRSAQDQKRQQQRLVCQQRDDAMQPRLTSARGLEGGSRRGRADTSAPAQTNNHQGNKKNPIELVAASRDDVESNNDRSSSASSDELDGSGDSDDAVKCSRHRQQVQRQRGRGGGHQPQSAAATCGRHRTLQQVTKLE